MEIFIKNLADAVATLTLQNIELKSVVEDLEQQLKKYTETDLKANEEAKNDEFGGFESIVASE